MAGLPVGVQVLGRPPVGAAATIARAMEIAGADSFWAPDHWMWLVPLEMWDRKTFPPARFIKSPEDNFDAFSFLTWLATRTRRARVGVAVTESIRRHPAEIAQASLSIHHLSKGRFVLGLGAGERENVEPYGLSYAGQVSRLEEALYVIRVPLELPLDAELLDEEEQAEASIAEAKLLGGDHGVTVEGRTVRARSIGQAIVEEARESGADLIVLGSSPRWRRQSRFFSPTVEYVLKKAPTEVLIVAFPQGVLEQEPAPA